MKIALPMSLLIALVAAVPAMGQQSPPPSPGCQATPGCGWVLRCFPRCGCCDDYCPHPYPPPCWAPYTWFYQCVPAGNCPPSTYGVPDKDRISLWFIPTPLTLREALWQHP